MTDAENGRELPEEERQTGRQMLADSLASVAPAWADEDPGYWMDLAADLVDELDRKGLLVVHETILTALKNGVRNA